MQPKYKFGKALKGVTSCHLAIIRHKNIKTSLYALSKNDLVMQFLYFLGIITIASLSRSLCTERAK